MAGVREKGAAVEGEAGAAVEVDSKCSQVPTILLDRTLAFVLFRVSEMLSIFYEVKK